MTAVTLTELSVTDLPQELKSGIKKTRALVAIRYTSASNSDTLDLSTYIPGIADIEGVVHDTMNNIVAATSITWSTYTITAAGDTGSGIGECSVIVNFTDT